MTERLKTLLTAFLGAVVGSVLVAHVGATYVPRAAHEVFAITTGGCPSYATELTAVRGRTIVGLVSAGTNAATVGTALTNTENRPAGQHTHVAVSTVTDPGHTHRFSSDHSGVGGGPGDFALNGGSSWESSVNESSTTGVTVGTTLANPAGSVAGTPAPYIQYIYCETN